MSMATENELNAYGYQLLAEGKADKAIEMFTLNTQKYPKSANTWDSLGEAYFTRGDKKNAAVYFKKALSANPSEGTKANSEKYLKQMGAM
jgi:Tfp pilus assembly protein PilF